MSSPDAPVGPTLAEMLALFPGTERDFAAEEITAGDVPQPYRGLLVHHHHMTVTVERHYGSPVDVWVLDVKQEGDLYARKILLALQSTGQVVQFGIARIHLDYCSKAVRREIEARETPLGRILINHKVLRHIRPTAYLKVTPGTRMREWFGLAKADPATTFGRLGVIFTNHEPAIEVLEILAPVVEPEAWPRSAADDRSA